MVAHDCACLTCRGVALSDRPLAEGHLAVRFPGFERIRGRVHVYFEGVEITDRTPEVFAGDDGWAVVYGINGDGRRHPCVRCRDEACADIVHGQVNVAVASAPA